MATRQLLEYIKQQQQKGIPPEAIKNSLISAGWKISDVEKASQSLSSPFPPSAPSPQTRFTLASGKKLWFILGIICLLLIAVVSGGFYLSKGGLISFAPTIPTPTTVPQQPTPTPDPTSSWRIHTDETFKFSFRYPADRFPNFFTDAISADLLVLSIASDSGKPDLSSPEKIKQAINPDEPKIDVFVFKLGTEEIALEEFIASKSGTYDATEKEIIMIGGKKGYTLSKLTFPTDTPPNLQYLQSYRYEGWVKRGKYVYWFSLVSGNKEILLKNKYLFDLLLSTVKFIE